MTDYSDGPETCRQGCPISPEHARSSRRSEQKRSESLSTGSIRPSQRPEQTQQDDPSSIASPVNSVTITTQYATESANDSETSLLTTGPDNECWDWEGTSVVITTESDSVISLDPVPKTGPESCAGVHACQFLAPKQTLFTVNFECCELAAWVKPEIVEYDTSFMLLWSRRVDVCYSRTLAAYLKSLCEGIERDAALQATLLRASKTKMIDQLKIHPTWVDDVRIGSVAVAMQVGAREKAALAMTKAIVKGRQGKNWIQRSTGKQLEPVVMPNTRKLFRRVRWNPFVRKWLKGNTIELPQVG